MCDNPYSFPIARVPAELQACIFEHVFRNTRLTFGEVDLDSDLNDMHSIPRITKPCPHSLALLKTSKQINQLCRDSWMSHVLFNFDSPNALLATLLPRGEAFIAKVRYIRILNSDFWVAQPEQPEPASYDVVEFLTLLPGLQLDTLYVLCAPCKDRTYKDYEGRWYRPMDCDRHTLYKLIGNLIHFGTGWRTAEVQLANSAVVTVGNDEYSSYIDGDPGRSEIALRWADDPPWTMTCINVVPGRPLETQPEGHIDGDNSDGTAGDGLAADKSEGQNTNEPADWEVLEELQISTTVDYLHSEVTTSDFAELQAIAFPRDTLRLDRQYDRTMFGIGHVNRADGRTTVILRRPINFRITRERDADIAHNPLTTDALAWLHGLSWQQIKDRYIDGTQLQYGEYCMAEDDDEEANQLMWTSSYEYECSPSKAVCRRILDETRRHNMTVCYDSYDHIHDCSNDWINYLESAIDMERAQLKPEYVHGDEEFLNDEWLESIGAVCRESP